MGNELPFTKGEKIAGIVCAVLFFLYFASYIALMTVGYLSGAAIILIVVFAVLDGIFMTCFHYPQFTNIVSKPENCTEKQFHSIRKGCAMAAILLPAIIFAIAITGKV